MREFLVGPYDAFYSYKVARKAADVYAKSIEEEVAEGPTVLYPDNIEGPVELWPVVHRGEQ